MDDINLCPIAGRYTVLHQNSQLSREQIRLTISQQPLTPDQTASTHFIHQSSHCYGYEGRDSTHKSKLQKLQMIKSRCSRIIGIYLGTTKDNFLHAHTPVLNLDENLLPLATNTHEKMNFHFNKLTRRLCGTYRSKLC